VLKDLPKAAANGLERASIEPLASDRMGFRFYRRKSFGRGAWVGLSKSGVSVGKRGRRGSVSLGRRGVGGSIRLLKGLSYIFRR